MNAFRAVEDRMAPPLAGQQAPLAIVIGSGFGGLATAIRLSVRGWRVRVLEKNAVPGGRAEQHQQDGFRFDAGPTIITAPFLLEELWALCGRRMADDVDLRRMDPFYRIRFDDGTHRTRFTHIFQKLMRIKLFATQGNKQIARLQGARIR
mgnify:CR=1 FL=1